MQLFHGSLEKNIIILRSLNGQTVNVMTNEVMNIVTTNK